MGLKLYYDLMSQPSRVLYIFLKQCKIPFEEHKVVLKKGEHFMPKYEEINPFQKVPALEHNGFKLIESVAILRYLCREFKVDDHWYPISSKNQARVDEYLEWQHNNTRLHCATYFLVKFLIPMIKGKPARPENVTKCEGHMIECLDQLENIWLKNKLFLTGDKISIADIVGACEVEQPRMAGFDPREGRPQLTAWLERVAEETNPHYDEAHKYVNQIANNYLGIPPHSLSKL
uniref:glutathione transferase n=1 Tax=Cephus cinctus TaxID=211228 RepID=A0A1W6L1C9_CEPCN|nr:glutathione-S-transferase 5 [Cephus cinctus]